MNVRLIYGRSPRSNLGPDQIIRQKDMKALGKEFDEEGYEVKV